MARKQGTRREVWEAAQAANLDTMIAKVSQVFGKDAIADISITTPEGEIFLHQPDPHLVRVVPGSDGGPSLKEMIATTKNKRHLKGSK
ncbi:hypothetical protein HOV35_gp14 [Escherichia phage Sortsne]|uniref:Uncharacterized protein n=1 Tax=Escherichia phage Sortsne TaxID=2562456 RepID=A0A4D6E0T9_9CAUD|nr:hypothetical protein HOV35_gp14 [Escherichia phage Sortsne]QBZ71579.1 hypothetical protein [Escherichia phage Sortsne]QHJ81011.1 MAG: hypothetical protein [Caudoviricetes sp.]